MAVLSLIQNAELRVVGRRKGRQSLGGDVVRGGEKLFHVHFDGADGKCQIHNLHIRYCALLLSWELLLSD